MHTDVLKVCKITTTSNYCKVGKLYVKGCLLLKTKNRALVRVKDMVKNFLMSRGASRTSWDHATPCQ